MVRIFKLAIAFLLVLFANSIPVAAQELSTNAQLPAAIANCVPQNTLFPVSFASVLEQTSLDGIDYYLVAIREGDDPAWIPWIAAAQGGQCQSIYYNPIGDPVPFSLYMPLSVAKPLTLARWRYDLSLSSPEVLQQDLSDYAGNEWASLTQEDVEALQQLNIQVPPSITVIPSGNANPPQF